MSGNGFDYDVIVIGSGFGGRNPLAKEPKGIYHHSAGRCWAASSPASRGGELRDLGLLVENGRSTQQAEPSQAHG